MSFRCDLCDSSQSNGTRPQMVVTKVRQREYNNFGNVCIGHEIVEEKKACVKCAAGVHPTVIEAHAASGNDGLVADLD